MYRGFKLTLNNYNIPFVSAEDIKIYKGLMNEQKAETNKKLDSYFLDYNSETISGTELQGDWFNTIKADIFLSHSHRDEEMAIKFSAWIYKKLGLKVFIDSCVWGYGDVLLKKLNDRYSKSGENLYDYTKTLTAAAHVHMMLSTALTTMMNNTECLLFLNTPNSVPIQEIVEGENKTKSPWIYQEIVTSKYLKPINPRKLQKSINFSESTQKIENKAIDIAYNLDDNHLIDLTINDLETLCKVKTSLEPLGRHILDYLYNTI